MAVNIEMSYAKKLGLPEYSSHQFSVSLTAEVARLEDVPGEVERVYQILQASVDGQIINAGFVPGATSKPSVSVGNDSDTKACRCSDKQRDLVLKIIRENGIARAEVEKLAVERFGQGVTQLNKLQMSGLIDELLGKTGRPSERQAGTVRAFPQRRAA